VPFPTKAIKKLKTTMKNCSEGIKNMAQNKVITTANDLTQQILVELSSAQEYAPKSKFPKNNIECYYSDLYHKKSNKFKKQNTISQ
jgi:hypothetical protein